MPITITTTSGNVVLYDMWDGFKKGIDLQKGPYVSQKYVLSADDWGKTDEVCNALMGGTTSSGGIGGPIARVPGFPCPTSPNLTCIDAYCIGEGERELLDGGRIAFNLPIIVVEYGLRPWEQMTTDDPGGENSFPSDDGQPYTYASMKISFANETNKMPGGAYKFQTTPQLVADIPMTKRVGTAKLNFTRHKVPYLPTLTILNLLGRLNDATFFGASRGQIMFTGGETDKEWESNGSIVQDVSLEFHYREYDWNMFPRTDNGRYDTVGNILGDKIYSYSDLRPLLLS